MMHSEFEALLREATHHPYATVSADNYRTIEHVYMYHPAVPDLGAKQYMVSLYLFGGMGIINAMEPEAIAAEAREIAMLKLRHDASALETRIRELLAENERVRSEWRSPSKRFA